MNPIYLGFTVTRAVLSSKRDYFEHFCPTSSLLDEIFREKQIAESESMASLSAKVSRTCEIQLFIF